METKSFRSHFQTEMEAQVRREWGGFRRHWMVVWNFVRRKFYPNNFLAQTVTTFEAAQTTRNKEIFANTQPWIRVVSKMKDF